ncbi:MAG TPA: hypothetical protein PKZ38_02865 [Dermatophilaceae bacterium]|nr:hypothetical protein [Dermatophilaceae bacterium]
MRVLVLQSRARSRDPLLDELSAGGLRVDVLLTPAVLSRWFWRAGPICVDLSRWLVAFWWLAAPSARRRRAHADLLVAADESTRLALWVTARLDAVPTVDGLTAVVHSLDDPAH